MRLKVSKSKNSASFYVTKTVYVNGKERTITVEKLGTEKELREKLGGQDPYEWAKAYIAELNEKEKENNLEIIARYSSSKLIKKDIQRSYNGGYLFLQDIYYGLKLNNICKTISSKYKFTYDLNNILSNLIYGRIIYPASKKKTTELAENFIEQPNFELHQVYRALEILAKESDYIQTQLYKNSLDISKRNTRILFYDCTNFFFEIEHEDGIKQYGYSKEHRPNPIVQMGLFMDGDGIPLAFSINNGNTNEQLTLKPLEKKIISDFELSRFVVCTDAGLASNSNRKFNDKHGRAFITTQSIKKLKEHLRDWALDSEGWYLPNDTKTYDISKIDEEKYQDKTFYKERWINENGLEQKLIVTYSIKYRDYQRKIRSSQVNRAIKVIDTNPTKIERHNQNDYKRFIEKKSYTSDGEIADNKTYSINTDLILKEGLFDGFYAVCTNLDDNATEIIKINKRRWEIEESFRIMKSEFKSRPVHLSRDDRILAHFITCFIALLIYRILEKKLGEKFTSQEIIKSLREMNFMHLEGEGYLPAYKRTDFTDALHETFGFRTDYQIVTIKLMKDIIKNTKTIKKVRNL